MSISSNQTAVEDHTYENFGDFSRMMSKPASVTIAATTGTRAIKKPQPWPKPEGICVSSVTRMVAKFEPPKPKTQPRTQQQQQPPPQPPAPSPQAAATLPGTTFRTAPPAGQTPQYSQVNRATKGTSSVAADSGSPIYEEAVPVVPQKSVAPVVTNGHAPAASAPAARPTAAGEEEENMYDVALRVMKPTVDRSIYEKPASVINDRLPDDERQVEEPLYAEAATVNKDRLPAGEKPQFLAPPPPSHKPPASSVAAAAANSPKMPLYNDSEGLYEEAAVVCKQTVAMCPDADNLYDDGACL